jgi:hypothetical protein
MPPRIAMQKFVEGSQNLRQTTWFVEGFAFDKPLSSKFVEKKFVEGSLKVIVSSLSLLSSRNHPRQASSRVYKAGAARRCHAARSHLASQSPI